MQEFRVRLQLKNGIFSGMLSVIPRDIPMRWGNVTIHYMGAGENRKCNNVTQKFKFFCINMQFMQYFDDDTRSSCKWEETGVGSFSGIWGSFIYLYIYYCGNGIGQD